MEDITEEDGNYVEYQTYPSKTWHPCMYERSAVEHLLKTQFGAYLERVKKTDCQAELRRLLKDGPPVWLTDPHALPLPEEAAAEAKDKSDKDEHQETSTTNDNETTATVSTTTSTSTADTHVCALWYAGDDIEVSAKLEGAVEGNERDILWDELRKFLVEEGKEPGDDDDGE